MKLKIPKVYRPQIKKSGKIYIQKEYVCKLPIWACDNSADRYFNTHKTIKDEAEKSVRDYLLQIHSQYRGKVFEEAYLDSVIEAYLNAKTGLSRKGFKKYRQVVMDFRSYIVSQFGYEPKMEEIKKIHIEGFLANLLNKGQSFKTHNVKRNVLTNLFGYAKDNNWISYNIVTKIPRTREDDHYTQPLTVDEVSQVLYSLKNDKSLLLKNNCYYEIMAVIYYAGLRISEVTHLLKSDIDFNTHTIHIHNKKLANKEYRTKTGKNWRARMNGELEEILRNWLQRNEDNESPLLFPSTVGTPIKTDFIALRVKKIMRATGICEEKISRALHRGRHTFCSLAMESGISESDVQDALGHSSNIMTKHYTHLSDEYKRKQFDKLSFNNKGLADGRKERDQL